MGLRPTHIIEDCAEPEAEASNYPRMKAPTLSLTLTAALAAFGSGCASNNPPPPPPVSPQYPNTYQPSDARNPNNTARGAVAGAVVGAVIGGIIGNNSEHGNTEKGAAIGAVAGGVAGAAIGYRADQREADVVYSTDTGYTVQVVPALPGSEPYETVPPQPGQNAVWLRGHYEYVGNGYQWQSGRWEIPPRGSRMWIGPSWQPAARGGYVYVRGHWQ